MLTNTELYPQKFPVDNGLIGWDIIQYLIVKMCFYKA